MIEKTAATVRGPWVLSLDIGTSSVRSALYDQFGDPLTEMPLGQIPCRWRTTRNGGMEAEPESLFAHVVRVVDAGVSRARQDGLEIAAVATAAFWHSILGVGGDGTAVTPLFGWGDTRAADAAARLRGEVDEEALHRRTGCFLDASYPAAKLLWLREARPDIFPRVSTWMSFAEYLALHLFGEPRASISMASGTGLLDTWSMRWDAEILEAVGVADPMLPPLAESDAPLRGLHAKFAARWPELAGIPWFPALGDGACANLGSGAVGPGRLGLTVGTTAALRMLVRAERPPVAPGLWCYRLDAHRFVAGRALSNGGNAAAALDRWLRLPPPHEREAIVAAMEPDSHGLTVIPYLVGERGPGDQPGAGAGVVGLTQHTTTMEILRAWLEAGAFAIGDIAAAVEAAFGPPRQILAGGGALHASPAWLQIVADVLGSTVHLSAIRETSARGAALFALERLGLVEDAFEVPSRGGVETRPEMGRHLQYQGARERQRMLEQQLLPFMARGVQPRQIPRFD